MVTEQGIYEGRKGQKRLKAIERQIEKIEAEFENNYCQSPEMLFLTEEIRWEGTSKLIFLLAFRNVHFTWNGLQDYGFIRLCRSWLKKQDLTTMTAEDTAAMLKSILPTNMCETISEELSALEIY